MNAVLTVLQYTVAAAFLLLAITAIVDALQHRERARTYLALSLFCFSLVPAIGLVQTALRTRSTALTYITVLAFLGSGCGILLFRSCFIALSRRAAALAGGAVLVSVLLVAVFGLPPKSRLPLGAQPLVSDFLILTWVGLVGEPIVRFWLASRDRPPVQRARLRGLSVAFAVLIAILLVGTVAGSRLQSPEARLVTQLIALAMVPVLYGSLAQPGLMGRQWAVSEQGELQQAIKDLLVFSPDRETAAARAVRWASRLVGADAAFILDVDGRPLAQVGMPSPALADVAAAWSRTHDADGPSLRRLLPEPAILLALPVEDSVGLLGALPGPFTPVFGAYEVGQ
ncbi:MAG TPA: hypothetical protein VIC57_08285, partial [Candidatus Dormibacteraeota bacterium]